MFLCDDMQYHHVKIFHTKIFTRAPAQAGAPALRGG
jgi:hypothetical protein